MGRDRAAGDTGAEEPSGSLDPEDSFLVQIRGGSRLAERAISGRIEHLHSGDSEQFASLAELFDFLTRHFADNTRKTEQRA